MLSNINENDFDGSLKQQNVNWPGGLPVQVNGLVMLLHGPAFLCNYANETASKLLANNNFTGKSLLELLPHLGDIFFDQLRSSQSQKTPAHCYEVALPSPKTDDKHGKFVYIDFYITPLYASSEIADGLWLIGFDVTDRVISRRQAAEQQLLFKDITDAAGTALWTVDTRGNITFVNHTWIEWTGHPYEMHLGKGWIESVAPEDREQVISSFIRDLNRKSAFQVDFRIVRKDGQKQWLAATGKPRYLSTGEFAGYVGSCMDITDRKQSEQMLMDSEERFRNIADSAPVLIWMTAANKRLTFLNNKWMQFAGVAHLLADNGYLQSDLIHPDDKQRVLDNYTNAFENREDFYMEYRMQRADGVYRWIGMKGVPRYNAEHVFEGYIGSGMDITDMKEHEQIKNDFIGMASHELKTPITSIKAYIQLLLTIYGKRENEQDEFLMKSLSTVNKQINRLTRLITDLLDVSKMESGRLSLNSDHFTLHDLVQETVDEVQHTASQHDIVYHPAVPITIYADRDRIAQVITNFLTNAIKYSPEADRVDVMINATEEEVVIRIQDYGIGIKPDEQAKIFNRFYRVEGRNEQTFSGFGIGLFVAAEIVKRHNGRVWVESEKNEGASFYFTLPISKTDFK